MSLDDVSVGDKVVRVIGGKAAMDLLVTRVACSSVFCGYWEFDRATGAEIDEELGWGPQYGITGSILVKAKEDPS